MNKYKNRSGENHYNWKGGLGNCKLCKSNLSSYNNVTGLCQKCFLKRNKGKNASNWRGGKKNNNGYVMIYSKNHPNCDKDGYVREHRLVMEKYLDRFLTKNEVVHHKNGIRDDNRLDNLELLTKKDHDKYHASGKNNPFYGKTHSKKNREKYRRLGKQRIKKFERDEKGRLLKYVY